MFVRQIVAMAIWEMKRVNMLLNGFHLLVFCMLSFFTCTTGCNNYNVRVQINDKCILGSEMAWFVTQSGDILRTENGGMAWKEIPGKKYDGFKKIDFIDALHGWGVTSSGKVLSTDNGGETWSYLTTLDYGKEPFAGPFIKIQFLDEKNGWIVDSTSVWSSDNGGYSWRNRTLWKPTDGIKEFASSFYAINKNTAWIGAEHGTLYYTNDGGRSWIAKRIAPQEFGFNLIKFVSEKTGWVGVLASGTMYRTDDGGQTWNVQNSLSDMSGRAVLGIHFANEKQGWAVGTGAKYDDQKLITSKGPVFYTEDGGFIWNAMETKLDEPFFNDVYVANYQILWLIGRNNVYRTTDGGQSWVTVLSLDNR
jgi:photosystem II stability/assembly factor-like uncharacterized protein